MGKDRLGFWLTAILVTAIAILAAILALMALIAFGGLGEYLGNSATD